VSLRKQGANKGAVTSFLISTPESGVDSITITYALLDPILTVARPIVAFITAAAAGIAENLFDAKGNSARVIPDLTCPIDGCCDGSNCSPEEHRRHHSWSEKLIAGIRYAFTDFWNDLAGWFFIGVLIAGAITAFLPDDVFSSYLGTGLSAMLLMLVVGIPLYICATASTPIAAALILKGVSPGAALVFLLVGPATNAASLTVLAGVLGKRATGIYLAMIAASAVIFGLILDQVYALLGVSALATIGRAAEHMPDWLELAATLVLITLSFKPLLRNIKTGLKTLATRRNGASNQTVAPQESPNRSQDCGPT
jgi:uncharacterized membrane protein YraQ (UPF0718 family)